MMYIFERKYIYDAIIKLGSRFDKDSSFAKLGYLFLVISTKLIREKEGCVESHNHFVFLFHI